MGLIRVRKFIRAMKNSNEKYLIKVTFIRKVDNYKITVNLPQGFERSL